jgi:phosphate transport system substrate-binding protein
MSRGIRKLIACALVAVIVIGALAACGEAPAPAVEKEEDSGEEQAAEPHLSYDAQIPVIDGSVSAEALADAFYGSLEGGAAGLGVSFKGTRAAMSELSEGSIDAALIAAAPGRLASLMAESGPGTEFIELARDAVVLLVSSSNMVSDVSLEQASGIFNGDISNWKDAGGADVSIRLIQRSEGSEFREILEDILLGGSKSAEGALSPVYSDESGVGSRLASYDASPDQLAYAGLFLSEGEWPDSRALSVEGVYPSERAVASGAYPLSFSYYLVYRSGEAGFTGSSLLTAYMRSDFVQSLIDEAGYVPLNAAGSAEAAEAAGAEAAGQDAGGDPQSEAAQTPAAPQLPGSSNSAGPSYAFTRASAGAAAFETEYRGGKKTSKNTYLSVSGLADQAIQDSLNGRLEAISDAIYDSQELPPYRGIPDAGELFSHSYDRSSSMELLWNAGDIASVRIESLDEFDEGDVSVRRVSGLTVDLRNGAELRLADLFGVGFDYASVIDGEVRKAIRREALGSADPEAPVRLVSPYGGIRADQDFYLSSEGLNLIFDWRDGSFDLRSGSSWGPLVVTIGYDLFDGGIICGRDIDPAIYADGAGSAALLPLRNGCESACELIDHYGGESGAISMKSVYLYPKSFPRKLIARVKEEVLGYMPLPSYYEQYVGDSEAPGDSLDVFALARFSCVGPYYAVDLDVKTDLPEIDPAERLVYSLYGQDLEPVGLSGVFREGADCMPVIEEAVEKALKDELESLEYLVDGETAADIAQDLSFRFSSDSMLFSSAPLRISRRNRSYVREAQLVFEIPLSAFGDGAFVFSPVRSGI